MVLLHPSFLVFLSIFIIREPTLGADRNDDRIGTILAYMARMSDDMKLLNQKIDDVQKEVKDVARIEQLTSEEVAAVTNRVHGFFIRKLVIVLELDFLKIFDKF